MRKVIKKHEFRRIAQGVPHTNQQRIKYQSWEHTRTVQYDQTFMRVPSDGRFLYETVHLGHNEWLHEAKSQFNFNQWISSNNNMMMPSAVHLEICSGFGQWFTKTVKHHQPVSDQWIA